MDPLFQPITINKLELKNRICMTAMQMNMITEFEVTDRICEFYAERARGGTGTISVGVISVDRRGTMPQCIGAHKDEFIPSLARLASAIKDNGARAMGQINHTGRQAYSMFLPKGVDPVGPSAIHCKMTGSTPRELSSDEIWEIVDMHGKAAGRLAEAGFDIIEILMGTGYLVSAFLSPLTNAREDEWGGSEENRMKFGLEVLKSVRKAVGPDFPVTARINGNDLMKNGLGSAPHIRLAKALEAGSIDMICVNVGWHEARIPQITMGVPRCNYAYQARRIKEAVSVPIAASHRINNMDDARALIEMGFCDMIGMGRGLIADPYTAKKAQEGREDEIMHCIACGQGCFDHVFLLKPIQCTVNPEAGNELEGPITKAEKKKKVAIVGGGPAGMAAALAAHQRGHDATLFEKTNELGGQLFLAAAPPGREEFFEFIENYENRLNREGVKIETNHEVTADELKKGGWDSVILATGAKPIAPPIPGADGDNVVQAWDLLSGNAAASGKIVVVGGGAVGVETAIALAEEGTLSAESIKFLLIHQVEEAEELRRLAIHGTNEVTLVEMLPRIGKDLGRSTRWTMIEDLDRYGVNVKAKTKVLEITREGVHVETKEGKELIPADVVVMAVGAAPYNPLEKELEGSGIDVKVVGDAGKIALAFDAVHQGHRAGREL